MLLNRIFNFKLLVGFYGILSLTACSSEDDTIEVKDLEVPTFQERDLSGIDNGSRVMMQAFYWDVEPRGDWYNVVSTKLSDWKDNGVNRIWLPPPAKGQSGFNSMGYDPSDYFDLGEFEQHGTVETRFGSRGELESLIQSAHDLDLEVIADIVIGHNSGGGKEINPFRPFEDENGDTKFEEVFTLFNEENGNASGKFNRNFNHFHPNDIHVEDEGNLFFPETDLCHDQQYVKNWLWEDENISVANFYHNTIGFDGWRFDYVKSFAPEVIKAWNDKYPGLFSVGENFDGNNQVLKEWVEASGSPAFDFACFYKLDEALDRSQDLTLLSQDMLLKSNPDKAVTFVANHDTEKDPNKDNRISGANKLMAYAFILTHPGYPTIFYNDYENDAFKPRLQRLMAIHNSLATGEMEVSVISEKEYVMQRGGNESNPGLVLYMNISNNSKSQTIKTPWKNQDIVDYSRTNSRVLTTDSEGNVTIESPGNSYTIWSVAE